MYWTFIEILDIIETKIKTECAKREKCFSNDAEKFECPLLHLPHINCGSMDINDYFDELREMAKQTLL